MNRQFTYTTASSDQELQEILLLQKKNLLTYITNEESTLEGFVTVQHNFDILQRMNQSQPHTIAKDGDKVIGYALSMTKDFGNAIEVLKPMFVKIENSFLKDTSYIIMGQICIDKTYRKKGIFRGLYQTMQESTKPYFETIITEVDALNKRSLQAHYAIGFQLLKTYRYKGQDWKLIYWS
ncbi:hypothetical protein GCM10022393_16950 [Aquimarina addita]|uniref:N-acetyltransferase domain-containing protein n=1 Tax=Aquimarina addita TaxID=870485 RepID=A0ABP7XH25_9FLAO